MTSTPVPVRTARDLLTPVRRHVLEPLLEVWPDACMPDGLPLRSRLPDTSDQEVRRLGWVWGRAAVLGMVAVVVASAVLMWWAVGRLM